MKIFDMKDYTPSPEELGNRELAYNLEDDRLSLKINTTEVIDILNILDTTSGSDDVNVFWTKFPDGTLIQHKNNVITNLINGYDNYTEINFPITFVGEYTIVGTYAEIPAPNTDATKSHEVILRLAIQNQQTIHITSWWAGTWGVNDTTKVNIVAMGRWK